MRPAARLAAMKEDIDMVDTATRTTPATPALPKPDPHLHAFDRFIGTWEMKGRTFDSKHDNVTAQATFEYLPGGFFVAQRFEADFDGTPIESLEIIGYDPETGTFPSTVYANMAPKPLAYEWQVDGDDVTIKTEELGATFHGRWSGDKLAGGWRPNPGREGPENVPYDVSGHRA
jgi:hypothetical protein